MVPIHFLDLVFAPLNTRGALAWVGERMRAGRFAYVVTPNVDHIVKLNGDRSKAHYAALEAAVRGADLRLNDSRILARLARFSGIDLPLSPGSDLTEAVVRELLEPGSKIALIGGFAGEAAWLRAAVPGAQVFHFEPPMGVLTNPASQIAIAEFVETTNAQINFFAFGYPQSEIVCHLIRERGKAGGVGLCIGASIEFLSGAKRRAPKLMQQLSLEWAHRLLSEPGRMWRRYLVEGPRIFAIWQRWHKARSQVR